MGQLAVSRVGERVHTVDGIKVLLGLIVELLGFLLEFLESSLRINIDRILGDVANVEALFERLRRAHHALSYAFETHLGQLP